MRLYSKDNAVGLIRSMILRDRLSHAYILCGEKGIGKKTLAKYMAAQILCEKGSGEPCGVCKACRMLEIDGHPDFITVEASGKTGNYRADDLRPIISDASVLPNEGGIKLYFLPRIDKALAAAQNVLLKIIEEPPAHVVFIMTAESKERILPTVLSRAICINIAEPTADECRRALSKMGFAQAEIDSAVSLFGGNIGRCAEYIRDDGAKKLPETVRSITENLVSGDEYGLLRALSSLEKDREMCLSALAELKNVIRDAVAAKVGGELGSLCRSDAEKLSQKLRLSHLEKMYDDIASAENKINGNSSMALTLGDLCGRLSVNR